MSKKIKPVFKGEKLDRTSGERRLCDHCSDLATHRAQLVVLNETGQWPEVFFCNSHVESAVKEHRIHRLGILPEYRVYLSRMKKWRALQDDNNQGALFS